MLMAKQVAGGGIEPAGAPARGVGGLCLIFFTHRHAILPPLINNFLMDNYV